MPVLLYLLAVAVFAQGTSEFVLAGLLPGISRDLGVSLGEAGLLTSGFALGMVVGAPAMALAGRRLSPRWTLTGFLALFIAAHAVGALSGDFGVLLASRVIAALANAGFLAVTLSTVLALVPADRQARALSVVLGGTTLALIAGVPGGAAIGELLGWRAALWAIAALCVPALLVVAVATPTRFTGTAETGSASLRQELAVLRNHPAQASIVLAVLVNAATFCTFTYLAPLATDVAVLAPGAVPLLLAVFGVGTFVGVSVTGRLGDRHWRRLIGVTAPVLLLGWIVVALTAQHAVALWVLAPVMGGLSFALGSTLIARIAVTTRAAPTMGGSFSTVALNLGAILGPATGGMAIGIQGPRGPVLVSAAFVLLALACWWAVSRALRGDAVPSMRA
ncbi:Cmx/CmrA family chloramphenicol efflux MFS transporter [Microtetraspora fusca]|uniref:Cmx/CmrA family chloramphenicol efflux MFS transporter n=1 Tax=Microtetraspora fusca TaxID=1997 RepID=UPI00082DF525|nr:Cmx/CmrA family chloramphenicol efflux MFS transporter [Microtetraspora fusca]